MFLRVLAVFLHPPKRIQEHTKCRYMYSRNIQYIEIVQYSIGTVYAPQVRVWRKQLDFSWFRDVSREAFAMQAVPLYSIPILCWTQYSRQLPCIQYSTCIPIEILCSTILYFPLRYSY